MSNLISSVEAANRLGISIWTLYNWVRAGLLPSIRINRKILFDPKDVECLIEKSRKG